MADEPRIPRPPGKEEIERISRDQAMITDDWTGDGPEQGARDEETPTRREDKRDGTPG